MGYPHFEKPHMLDDGMIGRDAWAMLEFHHPADDGGG